MAERKTTEKFIVEAVARHGHKYDYSKTVYTNSKSSVIVTCPSHGDFLTLPQDHIKGTDCKQCALVTRGKRKCDTTETFVAKAQQVHGVRFDYSIAHYVGDKVPVSVVCRLHGAFQIRPRSHLDGYVGCSECERSGFKRDIPATLYLLKSSCGIVKIGITNRTVGERLSQINRHSPAAFEVHASAHSSDGARILKTERRMLRELRHTYKNPDEKFDGYTECFVGADVKGVERMLYSIMEGMTNG